MADICSAGAPILPRFSRHPRPGFRRSGAVPDGWASSPGFSEAGQVRAGDRIATSWLRGGDGRPGDDPRETAARGRATRFEFRRRAGGCLPTVEGRLPLARITPICDPTRAADDARHKKSRLSSSDLPRKFDFLPTLNAKRLFRGKIISHSVARLARRVRSWRQSPSHECGGFGLKV